MTHSSSEKGSVLWLILVGIAMFAALSYVMSQSSRTSGNMMSQEQAKLAAQEVVSYGDAIAGAVQKLKLRGCTNEQISFDKHNGMSKLRDGGAYDYTHATSPDDGSCEVFNINGGAVTPAMITAGTIDPALMASNIMHPQSFYVSAMRVIGFGSDAATAEGSDLVLRVGRLKQEVCIEVNKLLGVTNPNDEPPEDTSYCNNTPFAGTYQACTEAMGNVTPALQGQVAFCSDGQGDETDRIYYRVLIAR